MHSADTASQATNRLTVATISASLSATAGDLAAPGDADRAALARPRRMRPAPVGPSYPKVQVGRETKIGTDITPVADIAESIGTFGDRYLSRVYTPLERAQSREIHERLASRFAGKEAIIKVLCPLAREALPFHDIEILLQPSGAPYVRLHRSALAHARAQHLTELSVSLSHDGGFALAVALGRFESRNDRPSFDPEETNDDDD